MPARHRMRERMRPRASTLSFLTSVTWSKTRRCLALRPCLEFGDFEGASASASPARAVGARRADCCVVQRMSGEPEVRVRFFSL